MSRDVGLGALILLIAVGGCNGEPAGVAGGPRAPEPAAPADPLETVRLAAQVAGESYYLREIHKAAVDVPTMLPTLLTPRRKELIPDACPEHMRVRHGEDSYATAVAPFADGIGALGLAPQGSRLAREVAARLAAEWKKLRAVASGPMTEPPLRVLVKHYPRRDLPGRCVVVHISFYTLPDRHFDGESAIPGGKPATVPGVLFEVRKTYQLEKGVPRLVEAVIEVETGLRAPISTKASGELLGGNLTGRVGRDALGREHFQDYGGGRRSGLAWFERSAGMYKPRPKSCAYEITFGEGAPEVETAPLPMALQRALLEIVSRA